MYGDAQGAGRVSSPGEDSLAGGSGMNPARGRLPNIRARHGCSQLLRPDSGQSRSLAGAGLLPHLAEVSRGAKSGDS
jgi:hypothetical protein